MVGELEKQVDAMNNLLFNMGRISFTNFLYSREMIDNNRLLFDENTKFGEDREFNWKYLANCQKIAFVNKSLYWYRINPKSATKTKATWRKTDLLTSVKRTSKYLEDKGIAFAEMYDNYMYARSAWAVAKTFAISKDRDLFLRYISEFPVSDCMKQMLKDKNPLVRISSACYLLSPNIFYFIISHSK